jgi:hypothetical protein
MQRWSLGAARIATFRDPTKDTANDEVIASMLQVCGVLNVVYVAGETACVFEEEAMIHCILYHSSFCRHSSFVAVTLCHPRRI